MIKIYEEFEKKIDDDAWDFPINELGYLLEEHRNGGFVLKNNRLYEVEEEKKCTLDKDTIIDLLERRIYKYWSMYPVAYEEEEQKAIKESVKRLETIKNFIINFYKNNDELINFILKI